MTLKKTTAKKITAAAGKALDDAYFAQQTPDQRALLVKVRAVVRNGMPGAEVSIKWGVPFYAKNGRQACSLASFKEFVAITFFAPPAILADPKKRLEGGGASMRMYKVRTASDIDNASITRWLKATVAAGSGMRAT